MRADQTLSLLEESNLDLPMITKNINSMIQTTEKIATIISGLRNFSRDAKNDNREKTLVKVVIKDTLSFSREKIINHGIRLEVNHSSHSIAIQCRAVEISQVLLNLLNNAHDAVVDQPGEKWIIVESKVSGEWVEISVTDSGPAITPELREKIFMPFFTTKDVGKGTGLGLSISSGIMKAHEGSLFLDAESPHTRFVLRCPLSPS